MGEYRLYFLDEKSHIVGRVEFVAGDDALALRIAATLCEETSDQHSGYMLWRGTRQIFASDEGGEIALIQALASKPLPLEAQEIVLSLEERLLQSHWCIGRSQRLLEAICRLQQPKLAS